VFTPQQRQMFKHMQTPGYTTTPRDRMAAVKETRELYGTFTGDTAAAPMFLYNICTQIQKYKFTTDEVVQVLTASMQGEARSWFTATWNECGQLDESDKPIQMLFHRFIDRWMSSIARSTFKNQLAATKLQSDKASLADLKHHYAKYAETVNNLRMCDQNLVMSDVVEDYYRSLPNECKRFIGDSFKSATSIDDIQHKAEAALMYMHQATAPKQDGSMTRPISVNAMSTTTQSAPPSSRPVSPTLLSQSTRRSNSRPRVAKQCWHCGSKEHWTGTDCPVFDKPQTSAGKDAWKKRNEGRRAPYDYDKTFFEQRSKENEAKKAAQQSGTSQGSGSASRDPAARPRK
jgi:hypothetical protein